MLVLLGTLAVAVFGVTVFHLLAGDWLTNGCAISAPFGWTIPLTTAFVVLGVAWLLMSQPRGRRTEDPFDMSTTLCPDCGRTVLRDWRLCPYCTASLEDDALREQEPPLREESLADD